MTRPHDPRSSRLDLLPEPLPVDLDALELDQLDEHAPDDPPCDDPDCTCHDDDPERPSWATLRPNARYL